MGKAPTQKKQKRNGAHVQEKKDKVEARKDERLLGRH